MAAFQLHPGERRQLLELLDHPDDAKQLRRAQALMWLHHERLRQAGVLSGNFWLTK